MNEFFCKKNNKIKKNLFDPFHQFNDRIFIKIQIKYKYKCSIVMFAEYTLSAFQSSSEFHNQQYSFCSKPINNAYSEYHATC